MQKTVTSMGLLWSAVLAPGQSISELFWPFDSVASGDFQYSSSSIWARPTLGGETWEPQYWLTITPTNPIGAKFIVPFDQQVGITSVIWIKKGEMHELDGTGGAGDLVLQVGITNFMPDQPCNFDLWLHRADFDLHV